MDFSGNGSNFIKKITQVQIATKKLGLYILVYQVRQHFLCMFVLMDLLRQFVMKMFPNA